MTQQFKAENVGEQVVECAALCPDDDHLPDCPIGKFSKSMAKRVVLQTKERQP